MGNAMLVCQTGMLNQPSVGLERATKLLVAGRSRKSKPTETESHKPFAIADELAAALAAMPTMTDTDSQEMREASRPGLSYWHDEAGNIMEVGAPDGGPTCSQSVNSPPDKIVWLPEPITALWRNKDHDVPVILVAKMSEPGLPDYYLTDTKTGIPASEVFFED